MGSAGNTLPTSLGWIIMSIMLCSISVRALEISTEHHHHHSSHHHHHREQTTEILELEEQHEHEDHGHYHDEDEVHHVESRLAAIPDSTWLASFCSIGVISVVGLMTVAIIPLLKGPHQDTVLQVLVSLAVGTLVGDALIHLLPHALLTDHGDTDVVWKGFAATITILCFYVMDRVLESLGQGHSHAPVEQLSDQSSDVENLTVTTSASRDSSPVSKVIINIFDLDKRI